MANAPVSVQQTREHLHALSSLTLNPRIAKPAAKHVAALGPQPRQEFLSLADSHHVVIRALTALREQTSDKGLLHWAEDAIAAERSRVAQALPVLDSVCRELEAAGCPVVVMKSLDHLPDLGSDLDLYTTGDERAVVEVITGHFHGRVEPQSWGDRLARKWNFSVPGLKEALEVHVGRLGQTGEHVAMSHRFVSRRVPLAVERWKFFVPAPEERVIVATLQRMYRHFYMRLCDVANTAQLIESQALDYRELAAAAESGGIWPGVATYLCLVSDYVSKYRDTGLHLPHAVLAAARFGGDRISVGGRFLRIPKLPEGAGLYLRQLAKTVSRHDFGAAARLSLLPPLASAAAVAYTITGSDKGIW